MQLIRPFLLAAAACAVALSAHAQTKWDLPAAYPATNFHTVNLRSSPPTSTRPPAAS